MKKWVIFDNTLICCTSTLLTIPVMLGMIHIIIEIVVVSVFFMIMILVPVRVVFKVMITFLGVIYKISIVVQKVMIITVCHAPKSMMNCGKPFDGVTGQN